MNKVLSLVTLSLVLVLFSGCGSKVSIEQAKAKIDELAAKGVPESDMADLKLFLYQMETAKKTGSSGIYRLYQDSLTKALGDFEANMTSLLEKAGPAIDSLKKITDEKMAKLKGLHLKNAEPTKGIIDSLIKNTQPLMARARLEKFDLELDTLIMQQNLADSVRKQIVGAWVLEKESPDPQFNVVERTEIVMKPDGSLFIMERKKGKTSESSIEDWEYRSTGTWDLMGDVAVHYITNEKRIRQNFQYVDQKTGKWKKESKPPYDSTYSNHAKDREVAYEELKRDFKKFPIKK